ncbi:MAG: hypothetical protein ACK5O7_02500 [Holosporales bacterium]
MDSKYLTVDPLWLKKRAEEKITIFLMIMRLIVILAFTCFFAPIPEGQASPCELGLDQETEEKTKSSSLLADLPEDMVAEITSYLETRDRYVLMRTSRALAKSVRPLYYQSALSKPMIFHRAVQLERLALYTRIPSELGLDVRLELQDLFPGSFSERVSRFGNWINSWTFGFFGNPQALHYFPGLVDSDTSFGCVKRLKLVSPYVYAVPDFFLQITKLFPELRELKIDPEDHDWLECEDQDDFKCDGMNSLAQCKNLKKLHFHSSVLKDHHLRTLVAALPNLNEVGLFFCSKLTAEGLRPLARLTQLTSLDISLTKVDAPILKELCSSLTLLQSLRLHACQQLRGTQYAQSLKSVSLQSLDLTATFMPHGGLGDLALNVPNLRYLNLRWYNSSEGLGPDLIHLGHWATLEEVNLARSTLDVEGLHALMENNQHLRILNLSQCTILRSETLFNFGLSTALTCVDLCDTRISDKIIESLIRNNVSLHTLNLSKCKFISPAGFTVLQQAKKLTNLNVSNTYICGDGLRALCENKVIRILDLSDCDYINADEASILASLTTLQEINLERTMIGTAAILALIRNNPLLKQLQISSGDHVDAWAVSRCLHDLYGASSERSFLSIIKRPPGPKLVIHKMGY